MAEYDFSKPAPDRSHRMPRDGGSGLGGLGLVLIGTVIVLVVLFAVFGGAGVPDDTNADPIEVAPVAPAASE